MNTESKISALQAGITQWGTLLGGVAGGVIVNRGKGKPTTGKVVRYVGGFALLGAMLLSFPYAWKELTSNTEADKPKT